MLLDATKNGSEHLRICYRRYGSPPTARCLAPRGSGCFKAVAYDSGNGIGHPIHFVSETAAAANHRSRDEIDRCSAYRFHRCACLSERSRVRRVHLR